MKVHLVHADATRLDEVMAVMNAAFGVEYGEAWTRSQCAGILPMAGVNLVLAQADDSAKAVGFALYRSISDDAELLLLAVSPEAQGNGIGRELLGRFVAHAKKNGAATIHLEVRDGNPAIRMYETAGFAQAGRRQKYYTGADGNQHDALTFILDL